MKKFAAIAALSLLATTGTAHANNFAGFRVEAHLGLDALKVKGTESGVEEYLDYNDDNEPVTVTENYGPYSDSVTKSGLLYGLGFGYDFAVSDKAIIGLETNLTLSNTKEGRKVNLAGNDIDFDDVEYTQVGTNDYVTRIKAGREFDISVRAGYAVTPSTLLYVKAGYVNGRTKLDGFTEIENEDGPDTYKAFKTGKNRGGYRLGAGIESLLGANAFIKAEYRYSNMKNFNFDYTIPYTYDLGEGETYDVVDSYSQKYGADRHQALVGIGFRF